MEKLSRGNRVEAIGKYRHGAQGIIMNVKAQMVRTKLGIMKPIVMVEVLLDVLRDVNLLDKEPKTVLAMTRLFPSADLEKIGGGDLPVAPDAGETKRQQIHWKDQKNEA